MEIIIFLLLITTFFCFWYNKSLSNIEKDGYNYAISGGDVGDCPYHYYEVNKRAAWIQGHCTGWVIFIKNKSNMI